MIVSGLNSQLHSSLLPHLGQLHSQFSRGTLHSKHFVYSAKSSLKLIPQIIKGNNET